MSMIEFHHVSFVYNKKDPNRYDAINDINFNIEENDFVALVGKTGSGKSTLVQTLNGLLLPSKGYTKVKDFIVTGDKEVIKILVKEKKYKKKELKNFSKLRKEVGMVFQFPEYQLFSETVLKDVMFGPKNFGFSEKEAEERAKECLTKVGLDESYYSRSPFELSGGEKRRVAIAGIIASNPSILVLDEPTVGLDPNGRKEILNLVKKIHEEGTTIIIVTHDMETVMNYANKVIVLKDSKYLGMMKPSELFNKDDIESFSLEVPPFYKFKRLLKEKGYKKNIKEANDLASLIDVISSNKENNK